MIIVTAAVRVGEDGRGPMLAAALEHCRRSRTEPGCIAHNVHVDCEDPCRLVFVEFWQDAAALETHFTVPESRAFAAYAREKAIEPPELTILEAQTINI